MQIKTITCHDVYNFGASLQALALQSYLEGIGQDVEIIDYKPDYLSKHFNLFSVSNPVYDYPIIKQVYLIAKLPARLIALRRKKKFDVFTRQFLHLTSHRYHSNEELKADPPLAEAYIAGSDQIWNTLFKNGRDAAFYLDFAPKTAKRIAYAASFATKDIAEDSKPFVREMLHSIERISIRERISLPLLESLGRNDGIAVCDPVFLLSSQKWNQILTYKNKNESPYLLVYDSEKSERIREVACRIAKQRGLQLYNVSSFRLPYVDKDYWCSSPLDFVRLIRDADFIVSNSFHATAFSLIFHREFCVVNRKEAINERMLRLLDQYGLRERFIVDGVEEDVALPIDYDKVQAQIDNDIAISKQFLSNSLELGRAQ